LSEAGQEAVFYGALVVVATDGGAFQASVIGAAKVLPGATLGLVGGAVGDALPRRVGLGVGYLVQAAICIVVPLVFGTGFVALVLLILGVSALNEFVGPGEKAVIPLVTSKEQISSAASILALADGIGTAIGTAVMAPIILVIFGAEVLFYICGGLLIFAAVRILALPIRKSVTVRDALSRLDLTEIDVSFTSAFRWLIGWPAVVTIIMVGVIVAVLQTIVQTLGPSYVGDVLGEDPAKSVYIFLPAGIGGLVALGVAPWLNGKIGERMSAALGVLVMSLSLFALAFVDVLAPILGPISPTNIVRIFTLDPSDEVLVASFISIFTGFAVSLSAISVQTYINKRVPMLQQGRVFGLQSVLANAAALIPLLVVGVFAELASIEVVLIIAPWIVLGCVYALLVLVTRMARGETPSSREVFESFWEQPEGAGET
jgi:MFS family permease